MARCIVTPFRALAKNIAISCGISHLKNTKKIRVEFS